MNIQKRIEEAAVFWCRDNQFDTHKDRGTSFKDGAHFGFSLAVEMLRSDEAETGIPKKPYQFDNEKVAGSAKQWADWLTKMKEQGEG